jgi:hypothetical protein
MAVGKQSYGALPPPTGMEWVWIGKCLERGYGPRGSSIVVWKESRGRPGDHYTSTAARGGGTWRACPSLYSTTLDCCRTDRSRPIRQGRYLKINNYMTTVLFTFHHWNAINLIDSEIVFKLSSVLKRREVAIIYFRGGCKLMLEISKSNDLEQMCMPSWII